MAESIYELKERIAEKNIMLNSLKPDNKLNLEKKQTICLELDKLLYLYYKSLKSA